MAKKDDLIEKLKEEVLKASKKSGGDDFKVDFDESILRDAPEVAYLGVVLPGEGGFVSLTRLQEALNKTGKVDFVELYAPPKPKILIQGRIENQPFSLVIALDFPPENYTEED